MHGKPQRLPFDVPQRQVERAQGMRLLAARRVEPGYVHLLPDGFDVERVLADQRPRALLQSIFGATLADAGETRVRLHHHHHVALVE